MSQLRSVPIHADDIRSVLGRNVLLLGGWLSRQQADNQSQRHLGRRKLDKRGTRKNEDQLRFERDSRVHRRMACTAKAQRVGSYGPVYHPELQLVHVLELLLPQCSGYEWVDRHLLANQRRHQPGHGRGDRSECAEFRPRKLLCCPCTRFVVECSLQHLLHTEVNSEETDGEQSMRLLAVGSLLRWRFESRCQGHTLITRRDPMATAVDTRNVYVDPVSHEQVDPNFFVACFLFFVRSFFFVFVV